MQARRGVVGGRAGPRSRRSPCMRRTTPTRSPSSSSSADSITAFVELGNPAMVVIPSIDQHMQRYAFLVPRGYQRGDDPSSSTARPWSVPPAGELHRRGVDVLARVGRGGRTSWPLTRRSGCGALGTMRGSATFAGPPRSRHGADVGSAIFSSIASRQARDRLQTEIEGAPAP